MASLTLVKLLFCGQGMTALVEVYDDGVEKPAADYLALVDCGGEAKWGGEAVDCITEKVKDSTHTYLDDVVISHQDSDHVALLPQLGAKLEGIAATVGSIYLGGTDWSTGNMNIVKEFAEAVGCTRALSFGGPMRSDYQNVPDRSKLRHITWYGDVYLRILVSNLLVTGDARARKNPSSAVVVVENGSFAVVLPGDATYQTMNWINDIKNLRSAGLLPPVIGLEVPHHGALATAVQNYKSSGQPSDFNWKVIKEFAQTTMAPKNVGASAGPWNTHRHPVQEVLEQFFPSLNPAAQHTFVSYVFSRSSGTTSSGWQTTNSGQAVECTMQALGDIPTGAQAPRKGVHKREGPFVYGDIVFKLAAPGVLRPEEMVEFRPRGTFGMYGADEVVVQAPAP